jgi:tRNA 2-selenouridine synthase
MMEDALDRQHRTGETGAHHEWIEALLQDYYDPMYDYQLSQKEGRIVVKGGPETIIGWASR